MTQILVREVFEDQKSKIFNEIIIAQKKLKIALDLSISEDWWLSGASCFSEEAPLPTTKNITKNAKNTAADNQKHWF